MKTIGLLILLLAGSSQAEKLTIFAATSLTDAFQEIGKRFETKTGTGTLFQFAGSQILKTQLEQGALADVYASANETQFTPLIKEGKLFPKGHTFAKNRLVVIVPKDNPQNIQTWVDLSKANVKLVLAQPNVPAGQYARQIFDRLDNAGHLQFTHKVLKNVVSEESNVRQVLLKVMLGEADAGVVYATDLTTNAKSKVKILPTETPFNITAVYSIGVVRSSANVSTAQDFIRFVLSSEGQSILEKWGFLRVK